MGQLFFVICTFKSIPHLLINLLQILKLVPTDTTKDGRICLSLKLSPLQLNKFLTFQSIKKNVISSGFVSCLKALLSWRYMLKEIHDELN